ncbi:MAG: NAD-dependent protein deacylase [Clostridia bacterium]|nr:NAD-dependent protein deacylase [Clostridia bacterium]
MIKIIIIFWLHFKTKKGNSSRHLRGGRLLAHWVKPNITHLKLAELERAGKLRAVITQNIDGLHQLAGSKEVLELHGSVLRNYCMKCHKFYDEKIIVNSEGVPTCECGGVIKPDVVLYEEGLDSNILSKSINYISNADMLIIGGTSLNVYPAAGLMDYYMGNKLVLINRDATPRDNRAVLVLRANLGDIFSKINIE